VLIAEVVDGLKFDRSIRSIHFDPFKPFEPIEPFDPFQPFEPFEPFTDRSRIIPKSLSLRYETPHLPDPDLDHMRLWKQR
jgi:hypothetical protein